MLAALAGCSTYQSATSYFNTYYNAKKQFDDAEMELNKALRTDRDTNYFAPPSNKSGGGNAKFDKVIEKCSKLIQYYPESNLVDDAILLIGKSGVHLGETEMAIRKFAELFQNFPESDLLPEAKLWNAKALFFSGKPDEALAIIEKLFPEAIEAGQEDIAIESQMLAAQIYFKQHDYRSVAQHLEKAVVLNGNNEVLAYAQYQLALCYDRMNEYAPAAKAYAGVLDFNPELTLAFRSRLRSGIMMTHADQIEEALIKFQDMNDEPLKPEEQALVDHEVANAYAMLGDSAKAFDMYQYVDTTYKRSDAAARSYYRQGLLMEEVYGDFKKAREYFDKAKSENQTSEIVPNAKKRSEYLSKYFSIRTNIKRNDSLYFYLVHEDSLKEIEKKKQLQAKSALTDSLKKDSSLVLSDSLKSLLDTSKGIIEKSASNDSAIVDEQIKQEENLITETEKNEEVNQHNEEGVAEENVEEQTEQVQEEVQETPQMSEPQGLAKTLAQIRAERRDDEEEETDEPLSRGTLAPKTGKDKSKQTGETSKTQKGTTQPATQQSSVGLTFDSLDVLQAKDYYELATLFLLDMHLYDSAQIMFEKVIAEFPTSPFVPRSLYTLAEIYRADDDTCSIDSLYRIIHSDFKKSEYGKHLSKYFGEVEDTVKNIDSAEVKYATINLFVDSTQAKKTIEQLEAITMEFPKSPYSMKAMYAIGWLYENSLKNFDSAASIYKKLIESFPSSDYALDAKPRVSVKENPESINQFVQIKEIQAIPKPQKPQRGTQQTQGQQEEQQGQQGRYGAPRDRGRDRNLEEEEEPLDEGLEDEPVDEEPSDDSGDDGGGTDDDGGGYLNR